MGKNKCRLTAKRITELRKASGLTQTTVAERLGITVGRYGHYERGFRRFPVSLIPKIAQALDCSETDLFGSQTAPVKRGPPSGWEKRIQAIRQLPREKQRELQNVVDALLANAG